MVKRSHWFRAILACILISSGLIAEAQYCVPYYYYDCSSGDIIRDFQFNTISHLNTGCNGGPPSNYSDFTGTIGTTVTPGMMYPLTVKAGSWDDFYAAFFDFNRDGDFADAGEFFDLGQILANQTGTVNITIPLTVNPGVSRVRIVCKYGFQVFQNEACGLMYYGETSDYRVTFNPIPPQDGSTAQIVAPVTGCSLSPVSFVTIKIKNRGTAPISNFTACYKMNALPNACQVVPNTINPGDSLNFTFTTTVNLSTPGTYTFNAWTAVTGDGNYQNDSVKNYIITNVNTISAIPYSQKFDATNGGFTTGGINSSWAWGTPNTTFVPHASSLSKCWKTNLSGTYNNSEDSWLLSPCFNFSSLTQDPLLRFSHIFYTETYFDSTWVEISYNGGASWQKLGTSASGTNWYNNTQRNIWEGPSTGVNGAWRSAKHLLTGTAGNGSVRLRFRLKSDPSMGFDGVGVDDFLILDTLVDVAPIAMVTPATGCNLSNAETVSVWVANYGTTPFGNFSVCYKETGATVCEPNGVVIPVGDSVLFTFANPINVNSQGLHTISIWTQTTRDSVRSNDTIVTTIENLPIISNFTYQENFNTPGTGGWTAGGINSSWTYGVPANRYIATAFTSTRAWVTNLIGDYNSGEDSWLLSPCFDFSGLLYDPVLQFRHIFQVEDNYDLHWVELSHNGGLSWSPVGVSGQGFNWYNNAVNQTWDDSTGNVNSWRAARFRLDGTAGIPNLRIRFRLQADMGTQYEGIGIDDIWVIDSMPDAAVDTILKPASGCALSVNEPVKVVLRNDGNVPIFNIPVCFKLDALAPMCEVESGPIMPGATVIHTFAGTANVSALGPHTVKAWTTLAGDTLRANDTMSLIIQNYTPVNVFPYRESFESGPANWLVQGSNPSWTLGTPAHTVINTAGAGTKSWQTGGLNGNYNPMEDSWVISPCLNLTGLTNPWIQFKAWWESEFSFDGAVLEASTDRGGTWKVVGNFGDQHRWFNDTTVSALVPGSTDSLYAGHGWTGAQFSGEGSGGWVTVQHPLPANLAGLANALIRVRFASDSTLEFNGFAFDDVIIASGPPPSISLGNDTLVCNTTSWTINPAAGAGQFLWSNNATTPTLTVNASGNYSLVYTNTVGFESWDTVHITLPATILPGVNLGNDTTLCPDAVKCVSAGYSGFAYTWSNGFNGVLNCVSPPTVLWIERTDSFNCVTSDTLHIYMHTVPVVNAGNDTSICPGDQALFHVNQTAGCTYLWSNGSSGTNLTVDSAGTYVVSCTDPNTCVTRDTVNLVVFGQPSLSRSNDVYICPGGDACIWVIQGNNSCLWYDGSTTDTICVNQAGTYTITCEDINTCAVTDSIHVLQGSIPGISLGPDSVICIGQQVCLTPGGPPNSSYVWSNGSFNPTECLTGNGSYWVSVTDTNGCNGSDTVAITENLPPSATSLINTSPCPVIMFTGNATGTAPFTWSWDFGDGSTATTKNATHPYTANAVYLITMIATNMCGADTVTDTLTITCLITNGLQANGPAPELKIYPNPAQGAFFAEWDALPGPWSLSLFSADGRKVYSAAGDSKGSGEKIYVPLKDVSEGVYLLNFVSGDFRASRQVLIRN